MEKATLGFRIYKIWQILKRLAGTFHQVRTSFFWRVCLLLTFTKAKVETIQSSVCFLFLQNAPPFFWHFALTQLSSIYIVEVVQGSKIRYYNFMPPPQKMPYQLSYPLFWFCFKFDHKLLGAYTSLVQAVLSLAASRTRSCPRSLSITLLKIIFQNVKLNLFRFRLMVRH